MPLPLANAAITPLKIPAKSSKPAGKSDATPAAGGSAAAPIEVGTRIKDYRQRRKLSLRELAQALGCSASFLSRVETNKTSPTLRQLERLAQALSTSVEELISPGLPSSRPMVIRHASKRRTTLGRWNGVSMQHLLPYDLGRSFAALMLVLEKGGQSGRIHARRSVPELAIVLRGSVRFELADAVHRLDQGDCICYDISVPHQWSNLHSGPTEVVLINTHFTPLEEWPEIIAQSANGHS